ncbi:hypothetical protein LINPERHAP2_LOCUS39181 [Linum perenne]
MEFIYCLSGWEGLVHDGQVLQDAIARPYGLCVPKGTSRSHRITFPNNSEGFLTQY